MNNRFRDRFNYGEDGDPIPGVPVNDGWFQANSQTPVNIEECKHLSCYECTEQVKYSKLLVSCRSVCLLRKKFTAKPGEILQTELNTVGV